MIGEGDALRAAFRGETRPIGLFKGVKTSLRPLESVVRARDARRAQVAQHRARRSKALTMDFV